MAVRSPLFDLYDPYGRLAEEAEFGLLPSDGEELDPIGLVPIKRKPTISDLMPEEEKTGLLRSLAEMGTSGLSTVGYLLDTPGAFVRGVLAGDPLSVFGSSEERVTGRDLLRQYGMAGQNDTWGNFSGGLAAEVLLDPLTYVAPWALLGKGAYTPAGKALQATGRLRFAAEDAYRGLEPTLQQAARGAVDRPAQQGVRSYLRNATPRQILAEAPDYAEALERYRQQARRFGADPDNLDAPIAGVMEFNIPGTNIGATWRGGQWADRLAQGLDWLGESSKTNRYTGPVVSALNAAFHAPSGGTLDPVVQWDSRLARADNALRDEATNLLRTRQMREAMGAAVPEFADIDGVRQAIPENLRNFQSTDLQRALVDYAESPAEFGVAPGYYGPVMPRQRTSGDPLADWVLENVPEFRSIRDDYVALGPQASANAEALGLSLPVWRGEGGTGFFPRQLKWWQRRMNPERPNAVAREPKPWTQGERVLNTSDNFGRSRRDYTDIPGGQRTFRTLTGGVDGFDAADLQRRLIAANETDARRILEGAFDSIGTDRPFQGELLELRNSTEFRNAPADIQQEMLAPVLERIQRKQDGLIDLLRGADTQFAANQTGIFDTPGWENLRRYELGQNRVAANTERVISRLRQAVVPIPAGGRTDGMLTLEQAADRLGFDRDNFRDMWASRSATRDDPANFMLPERTVEALRSLTERTQIAGPERGLLGLVDQFTNAFKVGALASPAFHVRNTYSGATNAAAFGAFNPLDWWAALRASQGNYDAIAARLENAPGFAGLSREDRIARFLDLTGAHRVSSGNIFDDITGLPEQQLRGTWLGADNGGGVAESFYSPGRSWREFGRNFFGMRGVGVTQEPLVRNTNPLLVANDAVGSAVEDALRSGVFLNQLRKGVDPGAAADLVRLSQVDYSPQAFTSFERGLKRVLPFYSFQKGILGSIGDRLTYRPGGLQGQLVRAVTRGTEPSENNFIPEYLRQSAAIPLPQDLPSIFGGTPREGLQRYLTNIDLPFESTFNLLTPGMGATASAVIGDTLAKTGSNILGMSNPLIKAPIEFITNRQLFSGRDLSDLYSVLERDFGEVGRPLEQAIINFVPFGARGIGLYRQLTDERLDPADRAAKAAWNLLAGAKLTDIDQERSKRLAARQVLNNILETTPGVRTYENITVPEDVLRAMPQQQRDMYLLYKVIQSEAAKRARDRKKQQAALDPLELLGAIR
jgi:hypothetical protein